MFWKKKALAKDPCLRIQLYESYRQSFGEKHLATLALIHIFVHIVDKLGSQRDFKHELALLSLDLDMGLGHCVEVDF